MNLDELQSVQSRERQATSLQSLRSSFYQDAGEFIEDLRQERDAAAERADDPFSAPEVKQLTDDIETAKKTVQAIYERRVGKVVKMASIAAADMPTDRDGLTREEERLFDTLVAEIKENRTHILDGVIEGEGSALSCSVDGEAASAGTPTGESTSDAGPSTPSLDPDPEAAAPDVVNEDADDGAVNAADLMGGGPSEQESEPTAPSADVHTRDESAREPEPEATTPVDEEVDIFAKAEAARAGESSTGTTEPDDTPTTEQEDSPSVERTMVRITRDVGEIFGADERSYELSSEDVVTLPDSNAQALVQREAAEKLD
ncbi:DNA replication complex subunit Gins51 [Natronomonas sp. EA1]|uniref:DNA replication complex subunit Gins51 n=1 Tax=Natronomonas sp. EA1 TaxID=3421655 RepID=UPI003EB6EE7F